MKTPPQALHPTRWLDPSATGPRRLLAAFKAVRTASLRRLLSGLALVFLAGSAIGAVRADAAEMLSSAKLARLEAAALQLFDEAQHGNWPVAEQRLRDIGEVAEPVITRLDAASAPLTKAVIRSARALRDHDRAEAQHGANKILEWAAQAAAAAHPDVPPQVARLGYLAREIQIETDGVDEEKLAKRVLETRYCWDRLKPQLELKGDTTTVREGEAVIHQLELARAPDDFTATQPPLAKLIEDVGKTYNPAGR